MTPLAHFLEHSWGFWTFVGTVVVKWWTIWFVLNRNFTVTTTLTMIAVGGSAAVSTLLLRTGALGMGGLEEGYGWLAWLASGVFVWILFAGIELSLLTLGMKKQRPGWMWRRYDMLSYSFSCAVIVVFVALKLAFRS
ncbi:MAG: hypothetical protein OTJ44_05225 [Planctomycetota bacterium]|jgi:hypothetical protein|nr:hypothetical protein [Planctomycetota bacterium]